MKFVTSNVNKFNEFMSMGGGFDAAIGIDLPEIMSSDPVLVAIYKAISAGVDCAVEDTSLDVSEIEVGTNIRWLIDQLLIDTSLINRPAVWRVIIASNDGELINVFVGEVPGKIVAPRGVGFGFDPIFEVAGLTLAEHGDNKMSVSARKIAVDNFINNVSAVTIKISDVPVWTGEYQH